jgi:hypothetical protein
VEYVKEINKTKRAKKNKEIMEKGNDEQRKRSKVVENDNLIDKKIKTGMKREKINKEENEKTRKMWSKSIRGRR